MGQLSRATRRLYCDHLNMALIHAFSRATRLVRGTDIKYLTKGLNRNSR